MGKSIIKSETTVPKVETQLYSDVCSLIEQSKIQVAVSVNAAVTTLYWNVGKRINNEILQNKRADYGKKVIIELSKTLTERYGKG